MRTWVTLVCNVSIFICSTQSSTWIVSIVALRYYSKATHLSFAARVTTSVICSRSPSISVTVSSRSTHCECCLFRGPLTSSIVHFIPWGEVGPPSFKPSIPRSSSESSWVSSASLSMVCFCCAPFCALAPASFPVLLVAPLVSLMMITSVNFDFLVPQMPFLLILKMIFQLRGQSAMTLLIYSSTTI